MIDELPKCPDCSSINGCLGTEGAYFICYDCHRERYWTPDNEPAAVWADSKAASPYVKEFNPITGLEEYRKKLI